MLGKIFGKFSDSKKEEVSKPKKKTSIKAMSGILELTPAEQVKFEEMKQTIASVYQKYGFIPLDVSTIERAEILFAKGGGDTDKETYRFKKGDNDLALRFDLTVPLARYVAANYNEITFPFRRYQIGKVFRGERPQKGRFRELYQCDIDIIGDNELNIKNDAEIPSIIYSIFTKLNIGPFVIKLNNRKVLIGFLESLDLEDKSKEVLGVIDKIEKVGKEKVIELLKEEKIDDSKIEEIINFIEIKGSNSEILKALKDRDISNSNFLIGLEELEQVIGFLDLFNIPNDYYKIDLTIVRGLDYYTGTVYETFLIDNPEFGSICSGGRYDDLASYYTDRKLPGVGISIGLSRLFAQLKEKGTFKDSAKTVSDLIIIPLVEDMTVPVKIASTLRRNGIKAELYLEDKKMKQKFAYVDKKGVEYALIIGEDEVANEKYTLKNMKNGEQKTVSEEELNTLMMSLRYKNI